MKLVLMLMMLTLPLAGHASSGEEGDGTDGEGLFSRESIIISELDGRYSDLHLLNSPADLQVMIEFMDAMTNTLDQHPLFTQSCAYNDSVNALNRMGNRSNGVFQQGELSFSERNKIPVQDPLSVNAQSYSLNLTSDTDGMTRAEKVALIDEAIASVTNFYTTVETLDTLDRNCDVDIHGGGAWELSEDPVEGVSSGHGRGSITR